MSPERSQVAAHDPSSWEDTDDISRAVMPLLRHIYAVESERGLAADVPDFDAWLCSRLDLFPGEVSEDHPADKR